MPKVPPEHHSNSRRDPLSQTATQSTSTGSTVTLHNQHEAIQVWLSIGDRDNLFQDDPKSYLDRNFSKLQGDMWTVIEETVRTWKDCLRGFVWHLIYSIVKAIHDGVKEGKIKTIRQFCEALGIEYYGDQTDRSDAKRGAEVIFSKIDKKKMWIDQFAESVLPMKQAVIARLQSTVAEYDPVNNAFCHLTSVLGVYLVSERGLAGSDPNKGLKAWVAEWIEKLPATLSVEQACSAFTAVDPEHVRRRTDNLMGRYNVPRKLRLGSAKRFHAWQIPDSLSRLGIEPPREQEQLSHSLGVHLQSDRKRLIYGFV
ncbi:hypothetical protein JCM3765_006700 [Sporobolomyces pararoseus]